MNGPIRAYPARRRGYFARWLMNDPGPVGAYPARPRRPNRMRKLGPIPAWLGLLIVLLLVVSALTVAVAADTLVRFRVQAQVASALKEPLQCSPRVSMRGLSAMWQVRQQVFEDIRVRCDRTTIPLAQGQPLGLTDLRLQGRNVRAAQDLKDAVMGSVTLGAVLPYAEASSMTGSAVSYGNGGRIAITQNVAVSGVAVPVTFTAIIGVADGKVVITDAKATAVGVPIPQGVVDQVAKQVLERVTLPTIGSLTVSSIVPTESGLLVTMYGTEVPVSSLQ